MFNKDSQIRYPVKVLPKIGFQMTHGANIPNNVLALVYNELNLCMFLLIISEGFEVLRRTCL